MNGEYKIEIMMNPIIPSLYQKKPYNWHIMKWNGLGWDVEKSGCSDTPFDAFKEASFEYGKMRG